MSENVIINESDMKFGPYRIDDVFQIEKSKGYREIINNGIKSVEFVLYREKRNNLLFVEAKKSSPDYTAKSETNSAQKENCVEYITQITEKFIHSIDLYFNIYLRRFKTGEISPKMRELDYGNINIVPILIIKNGYQESIKCIGEILKSELNKKMQLWKIKTVLVISEADAISRNLATT